MSIDFQGKIVYWMKIGPITAFSIFGLFFIKGTDDQEWMQKISQIIIKSF